MRDPGRTVKEATDFPLICLLGPTAVGKTALAISLAEQIGAEIVSADSKQIYRFMDIGTAKPTFAEQERVPHHVIDCIDPDGPFSVADFQRLADAAIRDIWSRGKRAIIVGGSGLYFRALVDGLFEAPEVTPQVREYLRVRLAQDGKEAMHRWLHQVDPESAARIHVNDTLRTIRALEIYEQTGVPISQLQKQWTQEPSRYRFRAFVADRPRPELYQRIDRRVDHMLENGWVDEVHQLVARGYHRGLISMDSFGYRELMQYVEDELSLAEAVAQIKRNTRRFAKRQLTWFRGDTRLRWLDLTHQSQESLVRDIMENEAWSP